MCKEYADKHYSMTMNDGVDAVTVEKAAGSEWCVVSMKTNGEPNGEITIRSESMSEALRFMMGQMLRG